MIYDLASHCLRHVLFSLKMSIRGRAHNVKYALRIYQAQTAAQPLTCRAMRYSNMRWHLGRNYDVGKTSF
uniref:Uncharacterized protein n=1 Tax=mine drainage metagenome TaxID=410659 RepID=E6QKT5_9ZZZZ